MITYTVLPGEYGSFYRSGKNDIIEPMADTPDINGTLPIRIWRNAMLRFSQPNNAKISLCMVYGNMDFKTFHKAYTSIPADWNMNLVYRSVS